MKDNSRSIKNSGPYTIQLQNASSEIAHHFFRRQVLDRYKQDPRYDVQEWSFAGSINITDAAYDDPSVPESDKIAIQTFGKAYSQEGERLVAVIIADLADLSIEHQQYWCSFEFKEKALLDSDYVKANFNAEFSDRVSIFSALLQELEEINKICDLMREPNLFRNTYQDNRPRNLDWLTKPTAQEYNTFVHTLDKIISDNLNKDFFKNKLALEETQTKNGKTQIIEKGSIRLLEEYLNKYWRFSDPEPKNKMVQTFKMVRRLRQKPAHTTITDEYNVAFHQLQRNLTRQVYDAVRTLRLLLSNHPKAKTYAPPKWLQTGKIG